MSAHALLGRSALLVAALLTLLPACNPGAPTRAGAAAQGTLTIFAAASLTEAFGELGRDFQNTTGIQVRFSFAGSQQLAQQLMHGAAVDIFAPASEQELQRVIEAGVIAPAAPRIFARNRLVVIVPAANPAQITTLADLARPGLKLDLAAEQVPAGRYTRQALARLSDDPHLGHDFAIRVAANVVSQEQSVKAVVAKVALGEADAGIVYRSDVTPALHNQLHTLPIPDRLNPPIAYPIAPTRQPPAGSEPAQRWISYVLSASGQQILARYGFEPATP